jgi:hypothetical protein
MLIRKGIEQIIKSIEFDSYRTGKFLRLWCEVFLNLRGATDDTNYNTHKELILGGTRACTESVP